MDSIVKLLSSLFQVLAQFMVKNKRSGASLQAEVGSITPFPILPKKTLKITDKLSPNFSRRAGRKINCIVLHHTGSFSTEGDISWMCNPQSKVSAHYCVGLDGKVYRLVKDENVAWHAGDSELRGRKFVNTFSIGIEVVGDANKKPLEKAQYESLVLLVKDLLSKYDIPAENIVAHKDVCIPKGRKVDIGELFDWELFFKDLDLLE